MFNVGFMQLLMFALYLTSSNFHHNSPFSPLCIFELKIHHHDQNVMPRLTTAFYVTEWKIAVKGKNPLNSPLKNVVSSSFKTCDFELGKD